VDEVALVDLAVWPFLFPLAVLEVRLPVALVAASVSVHEDSFTVGLVVPPFPNVDVA